MASEGMVHELAIAAVFNNEADWLPEWLAYHRLMGVEHFYLYDNASTDHWREHLQIPMAAGWVEVCPWTHETDIKRLLASAFEDACRRCAGRVRWLMCCDLDEFMVPNLDELHESSTTTTLSTRLVSQISQMLEKRWPDAGGLALNWCSFGTSGVGRLEAPPHDLQTERLRRRAGSRHTLSCLFKSLVRPERVVGWLNSHRPRFADNPSTNSPYTLCAVSGFCVPDPCYVPYDVSSYVLTHRLLRLHHYVTRDQLAVSRKVPRRREYFLRTDRLNGRVTSWQFNVNWCVDETLDTEEDLTLVPLAPHIRRQLAIDWGYEDPAKAPFRRLLTPSDLDWKWYGQEYHAQLSKEGVDPTNFKAVLLHWFSRGITQGWKGHDRSRQ